jgi:hypothetical protein
MGKCWPQIQFLVAILPSCAMLALLAEHRDQLYAPPIKDNFPLMFKIHRYPVSNPRLHLPKPPVRGLRMAHQHPRFQHRVHAAPTKERK